MKAPAIEDLVCFESLTVGPVILEATKISAPYTLKLPSGETSANELVYSYSEPVFESSGASINLASVMSVQVALNYGLFCREIVFDGLFDEADKRFILDMLENTSREIYVNKFLMDNPFLVSGFQEMQPGIRKRYTAAEPRFINSRYSGRDIPWEHGNTNNQKYMVLSSGGKDSLLSYGLLKELRKEVYPAFVNESGRHWFSAVNAYRYFTREEENTRRVWCNSDRIFNWMARQMPFVRKNFQAMRADMYPIRLWTVAVFIFGVLPLARKYRVGSLVIGNEYDTTLKSTHQGIAHYAALYDQSRYFDLACTRYYVKKGWRLSQFSLLRSLSELLILRILCQRYPHLQGLQVSCHAAHISGEHAYPCGKCEKCRRIISMLSVLSEPAERCGYSPEQVVKALEVTENSGVKQLDSDAGHLYHLLVKKRLIPENCQVGRMAREHAPTMKLRYGRGISMPNDMPLSLYKDLLPIYLQYAEGMVRRKQRSWVELTREELFNHISPYPFEIDDSDNSEKHEPVEYRWESLTWQEIEKRLDIIDTAILPCGSIEQHGPHLPVDVDYFDSIYLARKVARACSHPRPFVLPAIPYGVAYHHEDFKGTVSVTNHALSSMVYDIGMSLYRNGIKKLIILNAHGDNAPTLLYAAQMINRDSGIFVCVESGETSDTDLEHLTETPNDIHAGEVETSTTLAVRPGMVRMDLAVNETMDFGSNYLDFSSERGVAWFVRTKIISRSGIMGNPTLATAEKGRKYWEIMVAHLVRFVEEVKQRKLDELIQRKY